MTTGVALRALAIWAAMAVCAVLNGILRQAVLLPNLGEAAARPLSALILALVIVLLTSAFLRWTGRLTRRTAWMVGLGWLVLTVILEFGLGLMQGMPVDEIVALYNPLSPGLWDLVLLTTLLAPPLLNRVIRG